MSADLDANAETRLRAAGLRPTRQRVALSRLLFQGAHRHITAEALHDEAANAGIGVSLATIYNTLHQFTGAGLLSQVIVDSSKTYFDTNVSSHYHFYHEDEGALIDIPCHDVAVEGLPDCRPDCSVARVDVIVRVRRKDQ